MTAAPQMGRRQLLLSIYIPALSMSLCRGLILPVMPLFALSFEVSYAMVGVLLAAEGVGNLLADIPAGTLVQRLGRRRSMLFGAVIMGLMALAMAQATLLWEAAAYRFVSGIGMALWNIARHAYITQMVDVGIRGRTNAGLGGLGRVAGFAAPVVGGFMAESAGLQAPFILYAMLSVTGFISAWIWIPQDELNSGAVNEAALVRLWHVLRSQGRILLAAGSGSLMAQTIRAARNVVIPLIAADHLGLDASDVGLIISLSYAVDTLMFWPAGVIMDRFGRKWAYVPSFILQSTAMACVPLADGFTSLLVVAMGMGLANGLSSGTMLTLGADLAPSDARGEFLGIWRFIGDSGHAAAPLIVGHAADLLGLAGTPFLIALIGLGGASTLGLWVPETLRRAPPTTKAAN
ncbi:MAG: MFS transporter [Gemmatimonadetes bacterium]|nr:MFS transporter [Gemmatimonadota bacterium]MBT7599122.1 MFS transporter [Gemmatimonadota bacterium]